MTDATKQTTAGRPRDTTIEARVLAETISQYGQRGWAGLSIERIASACGVGKASIYLRWHDKEELLLAALSAYMIEPEPIVAGSLEAGFRQLIAAIINIYRSGNREVIDRFRADPDVPPSAVKRVDAFTTAHIRSWRRVLRNAVEAGDLVNDTPITFLLNVMHGAVMSHVISAPAGSKPSRLDSDETFTDQLVDLLLSRFGAPRRPSCGGSPSPKG